MSRKTFECPQAVFSLGLHDWVHSRVLNRTFPHHFKAETMTNRYLCFKRGAEHIYAEFTDSKTGGAPASPTGSIREGECEGRLSKTTSWGWGACEERVGPHCLVGGWLEVPLKTGKGEAEPALPATGWQVRAHFAK